MKRCLVLGFFDGIHAAHAKVIATAANLAGGGEVILVTLEDSPSVYFGNDPEYIMFRKSSYSKAMKYGVSKVISTNFADVVNISAEVYLKTLVEQFQPDIIVTGFNYTFGYQKSGNAQFLKDNQNKYGYQYVCIPEFKIPQGFTISSTKIRELLKEGNVSLANKILMSPFTLFGDVIHGAKFGREMGFPTANLYYPKKLVKLHYGVYKVNVTLPGRVIKKGVMNWGVKPTFSNVGKPLLEVHLFDFKGNLYEKHLRIEVLEQLRPEKKFSNFEELKLQIKKDIEACLK